MTPLPPVCVHSKRVRVYVPNVPVCTGTTRTCWNTCGRGASTHGDVLDVPTGGVFESKHGFFHVFSACRNTHKHAQTHTPNTHHDNQQHHDHNDTHTPHNTTHNVTRRQTEKERQRKRDKTRQDKTRQDKTRQDKTRQDKTRQDKTRQDKTRQDKTRQDKTRQDKTRQDKTRQDKTRQDKWRWKRKDETREEKRREERREKMKEKTRREKKQDKRRDKTRQEERRRKTREETRWRWERRHRKREKTRLRRDTRWKRRSTREDERENEERSRWKEVIFCDKCLRTLKPARWISPKCFEKNPRRTNYSSIFFFESSKSHRVFNYLHRAARYLWSPHSRDVRICVSAVFILTSLKIEIARSVRGPKLQGAPCRRRNGGAEPRAENFGNLITAGDKCESRNNHRYAVVVQDLATQWIEAYPCKTETSQETKRSLQKFLEPDRKPKVTYTDNSLEFGKACEDLSWNHCTSTPHTDQKQMGLLKEQCAE